jgi:hypothetical protein
MLRILIDRIKVYKSTKMPKQLTKVQTEPIELEQQPDFDQLERDWLDRQVLAHDDGGYYHA